MVTFPVPKGLTGTLGFFLAFLSLSVQASFTAQVDRQQYQEGEVIVLTLQVDRQGAAGPNLQPLRENFDIVGQSQSSQMSFVNGRSTALTQWNIQLLPRKNGTVVIPSIALGGERTAPITLKIIKARPIPNKPNYRNDSSTTTQGSSRDGPLPVMFITAEVDDETPYVQQEIILTLTVHNREPLITGQISEFNLNDTLVTQVERKREGQRSLQGKMYQTVEIYFLITPQKSGTLTIPPLRILAEIGDGRPVGFLRRSGKRVSDQTQPLQLTVRPKPISYPDNAPWLPAKTLSLQDQWSVNESQLQAGEAVSRNIIIDILGQSGNLVPEFDSDLEGNAKLYPDQSLVEDRATAEGTRSRKQLSYAIVPTGPGIIELPKKVIYWWNTSKDRLEQLVLKGRTWTVTGSAISDPATRTHATPTQTVKADHTEPVTDDIARAAPQWPSDAPSPASSLIWIIISCISIVLWLVTTIYAWRLYKKLHQIETPPQLAAEQTYHRAKKSVLKALANADYTALPRALVQWGQMQYPSAEVTSLGHLLKAIEQEDAQSSALIEPLKALNESLYKPGPEQKIDLIQLYQLIKNQSIPKPVTTNKTGANALAPLYPDQLAVDTVFN